MPRDLFATQPKQPRDLFAPPAQAKPQQFLEAREPGMLERAGNWLQDNTPLPIDRYRRDAQSADDLARLAANEMTFHQADRLAGAIPGGGGKEQQWARTELADEKTGGAGDLAQIGGAVALPVGAAKQGLTLVGQGAMRIPGVAGALARTGLMSAEGAGYGAATAAGHGEDPIEGAKWGAGFGAGGQVLGEAVGGIVNALKAPASRSIEALRSAKQAAYKAVDESGWRFPPKSYRDMVVDLFETAKSKNISATRHPASVEKLRQFAKNADNGLAPSLTEIDQLRQEVWRDVGSSSDEAEQFFGRMMVDKIDDLIDTSKDASGLVKDARELNRRYKNAERFDEAMVKAQRRAASTDSGGNLENAQRQNARQILDNPRKSKFLNAEEKQGMEQMVEGTPGQNATRWIGKKLHSIPGAGAAAGLALTGGAGMAAPIAALLAGGAFKGVSRGIGNKNKAIVEALIREGKKPDSAMSPAQIQMIARALLGGGIGAGSQLGQP